MSGQTIPPASSTGFRTRITEPAHPKAAFYVEGLGDAAAACGRYAALLREYPLDLCCLGIGENGHLAFNDPPVADFSDPLDVKVVELDQPCRSQQVNEGHFPSLEAVPAGAITVTIPALLRAGRVLAIVPEGRKAQPVHDALDRPDRDQLPRFGVAQRVPRHNPPRAGFGKVAPGLTRPPITATTSNPPGNDRAMPIP